MRLKFLVAALILGGIILLFGIKAYDMSREEFPETHRSNSKKPEVEHVPTAKPKKTNNCNCFKTPIKYIDYTQVFEPKPLGLIEYGTSKAKWYSKNEKIDFCHTVTKIDAKFISITCGYDVSEYLLSDSPGNQATISQILPSRNIIAGSFFDQLGVDYIKDETGKAYLEIKTDLWREADYYGLDLSDKIIEIDDEPIPDSREKLRILLKEAIRNEYVIVKVDRFGELFDMHLTTD